MVEYSFSGIWKGTDLIDILNTYVPINKQCLEQISLAGCKISRFMLHVLLAWFSRCHPWQATPNVVDKDSLCDQVVVGREVVTDGIQIDLDI